MVHSVRWWVRIKIGGEAPSFAPGLIRTRREKMSSLSCMIL